MNLVSISGVTEVKVIVGLSLSFYPSDTLKHRDPLHHLLDYIAEVRTPALHSGITLYPPDLKIFCAEVT